jgi:hypothetical protein
MYLRLTKKLGRDAPSEFVGSSRRCFPECVWRLRPAEIRKALRDHPEKTRLRCGSQAGFPDPLGTHMDSDQRLEVFLPKLRAALVRNGMSDETAAFICQEISSRRPTTPDHDARAISGSMDGLPCGRAVLTAIDDGSEAAAWCSALAISIIDYEDAYISAPLHAGPPETEGQTGSA